MDIISISLLVTLICFMMAITQLYLQNRAIKFQLESEKQNTKSQKIQIRLLKKIVKDLKNQKVEPSEWQKQLKEEELRLNKDREARLQIQAASKFLKWYLKG